MAFTHDYSAQSFGRGAIEVDPKEIQKALNRLIKQQAPDLPKMRQPDARSFNQFASIDLKAYQSDGQFSFATRLARIAKLQALRAKSRITWKHRAVSLVRRLALLVMVVAINASLFF